MRPVLVFVAILVIAMSATAGSIGIQAGSVTSFPGCLAWSLTWGSNALGISGFVTATKDVDNNQDWKTFGELGFRHYKPGAFLYPFYGAAIAVDKAKNVRMKYIPSAIFGMAHDLRKDLRLELETRPLTATQQAGNTQVDISIMPSVLIGLTYVF
ncbi:MAG: hypothetical protein A2509_07570 [Candidatus Edwardsbacteria bacterium RIFOXYD12_FULL_50_11]|uniref:Outer membrane protein beta-barrel domain-containing protein n=1 Tax=Candidatus Edwardsbacteria bacterium GWF2_54_11 TaxID=1817851 RepID=A0A1F5RF18_9BACT|nr:MAG: hypothetical protein A2502_00445 [Candidatus Edwardsbacteria bacterium RifOxyC12_full_54_24]OGF06091.1 MAG: hypothetical protein A2273_09915 [Candidatus Edwardsbacteria bacterium RifOxyA12_full_54_48]OGF12673.1 MAG: hypothetical protein A2024_00380 [Candidatus Edwardsbacteria bacterium GWF2_54_11]OGF17132.1 MAG: hypothetical protein A2509_07570 [Candidatus Edwardsbacteria bacterium RIFOXYD12_FULL_50_11]OGJ18331.1 MAG: hypothetical protein A2349_11760 [Candidatus Edwardsbacteria bacteriu